MNKRSNTLTQKAMQALTSAVAKTVEEHRRRGIPLAVWRDGRPVSILPAEAGASRKTPAPYRTKTRGEKS